MRRIKLRFTIPSDGETCNVGNLFKYYVESSKPGDNFIVADGKLNMILTFDETPEKIIEEISLLPFKYIEHLGVEEIGDNIDSSQDVQESENKEEKQDTDGSEQVTTAEYLK